DVFFASIHRGPFSAKFDSRFTLVGMTPIKRFLRSVCYQGIPDELRPDPLKQANAHSVPQLVDVDIGKLAEQDRGGALKMQFMTLFTRRPDKTGTPAPAELREAEFEKVRSLYTDGLVRQIWLRGDAGGACMIVEAASIDEVVEKLGALPLV